MTFDIPNHASDAGPDTEPEETGWSEADEGDRKMDMEREDCEE